jgi:multiple sugar transport system permease protein
MNTMTNTLKQPKIKSLKWRTTLTAYSFILPNFIGFLIFTFIPIVISIGLSFMEWDTANPAKFVGLKNFKRLLSDETFRISFGNTIYYTLATVPLTLVCALLLAILLNKGIKGVKVYRAVFFLPYITSIVAVAVVWNMLLHPTMGPVNEFLKWIGVQNPPGWTASTEWALPAIIITSIWRSVGYYMVIYLAGLQGIPGELYEAATVDGANWWHKFKSITLPMLTPTTFFIMVMLTINSFKVFDLILVMTGGGPGRATNVLVYQIYNEAFINFKFGYSSAIAMVLFGLVIGITLIQFKLEEKWVNYF